ncbi:mitochondrial inner membrane protease subunit 1-like [Centruroides sculpturatus]|uniref:mitochondrial inner membrane protease subunit 1-like n=1 Tax=Centruroides sculpturatus TaxID=218467 RepID=UPI000C6D010E|nr:mitochondrial inner membrane protease subunit 1-like [Centruroides sculpturatus]
MPVWNFVRKGLTSCWHGVQYACALYCTFEFVGDFVICSGPSMEPTIYSNDVIVTEHISIFRQKIKRGDVIVSRSPSNPNQYICKRVVGLPGEKIKRGLFTEFTIPVGHVWLEGDNKENSTDSRTYGPVPMGLLRGRAVCKVWPFYDAGLLNDIVS